MDGYVDGWINVYIAGIDVWIFEEIRSWAGYAAGMMDGWMDRYIDGMDGWIHEYVAGIMNK